MFLSACKSGAKVGLQLCLHKTEYVLVLSDYLSIGTNVNLFFLSV